jgi:hypothetical protein
MPIAAAGKKAADNPAGAIFLVVLAGAVLVQGVKNLPDLGKILFRNLPGSDIVAKPIEWTWESIQTTAALNNDVITGFEKIGPSDDPIERFVFGEDLGVEVYGPREMSTAQKAYRGGRLGLFLGSFYRGGYY